MKQTFPESGGVGELQGLYGPLQILEGKIQQVWALMNMQPGDWKTRGGHRLRVYQAGRWNRGAGPDFKEALIELDGQRRTGDVEIHLYREDWWRHGHHQDPRYNDVLLHVVLFAGGMERQILTESGRTPEEWILGPWMREDIESVSGGEPGLFGELAPEMREWLESDQPEEIRSRLGMGADRRWQQKEGMARAFVENYGYCGALHRMLLYYLGFPYNRRVFLELADFFPMERWRNDTLLEEIRSSWGERIQWGMGRPANRAEARLRQYIKLNHLSPDWAGRLKAMPPDLRKWPGGLRLNPASGFDTRHIRKAVQYPSWSRWIVGNLFAGAVAPALADRLWADVLLPVLASIGKIEMEEGALFWFHSRPGSFPESYKPLLKLVGIGGASPRILCNGWIQGLIWAEDQRRIERVRSSMGNPVGNSHLRGA